MTYKFNKFVYSPNSKGTEPEILLFLKILQKKKYILYMFLFNPNKATRN